MMRDVAFPYRFDAHGRTARVGADRHVRDLLEQLLLTTPGERVMRPDFGAGLVPALFGPLDDALAAAMQLQVHAAVQRFLARVVRVEAVAVERAGAVLAVTVRYVRIDTQEPGTVRVERREDA